MIFEVIGPNETLKPFVHSIQLTDMNNGERLHHQKIVPYGFGGLIINFKGKCTLASGSADEYELPEIFIAGLTNRPVILNSDGAIGTIAINFYPTGLYHFLRSPASELLNFTTDGGSAIGYKSERLFKKIANAESNQKKLELAEQFLVERLKTAKIRNNIPIETAQKLMVNKAGQIPITELADKTGISISSLERRFQRQTGLTPKAYSKILRFNRVFKLIRETGATKWQDIIYRCGYYDQAHFIKEFAKYAGDTPGKFFQQKYRASEFYSGK